MAWNPIKKGNSTPDGPSDGVQHAAEPGKSVGRMVARVGAAILLSGVIAVAAVAVALDVLVDAEELAGWVAPRASDALNRSVAVGEASLVLIPRPGARISDVRVDNLSGFEGPPVFEADDVWMELSILPLFLGRLRVSGLRTEGSSVHLAIDEHGVSNFGDLMPRPRGGDDAGGSRRLAVGLRRIGVRNATVTFADAPESRAVTLTGVNLSAGLRNAGSEGWRMDAEAVSDSMRVVFSDPGRPPLRAEGPSAWWTLYGDDAFGRIELTEGALAHAGQDVSVTGRLTRVQASGPFMELRITQDALPAATLAAWMGRAPEDPDTRIGGIVGLDAQLSALGPSAPSPALRGEVTLRDVDVVTGGGAIAEGLTGTLEFAPDTLLMHGVSGTFAGGAFELYGRVAGADRRVRVEAWARPDLGTFSRLDWTPEWGDFAGTVTLDVVLSGSLDMPQRLDLSGTGIAAGLRLDHQRLDVPLYVPSGTVSFRGGDMFWSDVTVMAGQDPLQTTGRLNRIPLPVQTLVRVLATPWSARSVAVIPTDERTPNLEAALHGGSLDLDALLGRPGVRTDATYAQAAFAHLGRRTVGGLGAGVAVRDRGMTRPTRLPIRGSVALDLDTLKLTPFVLGDVSSIVELAPSTLTVRDAAFDVWGGSGTGHLALGIGAGQAEPFALSFALESVGAMQFFETLTPVGAAIDGALTMALELEGTTERTLLPSRDGLRGSGSMTVSDGSVEGTGVNHAVADFLSSERWVALPFEDWSLSFDVRDTLMEIHESALTGARCTALLRGFIALDGGTDLSLGLSIPPGELDGLSLRRTGIGSEVLERLRDEGSPLELGLRLSGPLAGPTVEPDATAASPP